MTYEILTPFGPSLYKSTLDKDFVDMLQQIAKQSRSVNQNVGNTLAGNLDYQIQAVMDVPQTDAFYEEMKKHVSLTLRNLERKYFKDPREEDRFTAENCSFSFGEGAWINFQKPGEFNPIHHHTGILSAVVYIDVPECIAQEDKGKNTNAPSAGGICWIYGNASAGMQCSDYMYMHRPKTGEIFIFPSGLQHLVYPFKSDVERISMSFNMYDINFLSKLDYQNILTQTQKSV